LIIIEFWSSGNFKSYIIFWETNKKKNTRMTYRITRLCQGGWMACKEKSGGIFQVSFSQKVKEKSQINLKKEMSECMEIFDALLWSHEW
jgi:hypothetical protein